MLPPRDDVTAVGAHPFGEAEALSRARLLGRRVASPRTWIALALTTLLAGSVLYVGYVGWVGSGMLVHHERSPNCSTPADLGWEYEAVNYRIADDVILRACNPDRLRCADQGQSAGDAVLTSDRIRIAGWYIPSADGDPPGAPTIVLVHGLGANKSDMLRYAATLHEEFNLVLFDLRAAGRSTGDVNTIGALESRDLEAILEWLVATKRPSAVGVLGDSGGAAAAAKLARTDPRIAALVLDSVHARFEYPLEEEFPRAERLAQLGFPSLPFIWAVYAGMWVRTGSTPGDADPIDAIPDLGTRPLMLVYGTADTYDVPARNAAVLYEAARRAGVPVDIHACERAVHGQVVNTCPGQYREWVVPFFEDALGSSSG